MAMSLPSTGASPLSPLGVSATRSDLVVEALREAILSGQLKPNEVLVERRIAEQLGISKTPVREAFIVLTRSGLLAATPKPGVCVRSLSIRDVRHIYEERVLLEPWAIENTPSSHLDMSAAGRALEEIRKYASNGDVAAHALANRKFHRAMYSMCENKFIVEALDGLQDLTALAAAGVLWKTWNTWQDEFAEHEAIHAAAGRGDMLLAAQLMSRHIGASIARLSAEEVAARQLA
jgi:DNA-binding GntR family transcriptional regulator